MPRLDERFQEQNHGVRAYATPPEGRGAALGEALIMPRHGHTYLVLVRSKYVHYT